MLKILYEWITKPYIQWNIIDSIICLLETTLLFALVIFIFNIIQDKRNK